MFKVNEEFLQGTNVLFMNRFKSSLFLYTTDDSALDRLVHIALYEIFRFQLSLYDLFYEEITCVIVSVRCDRRSPSKFWFDTGFKTDDMADIIKIVPHYKRGEEVPPKILYLTDSFVNYENIETANLVFKFEFTAQATINVEFYGIKKGKPRPSETNSKILKL